METREGWSGGVVSVAALSLLLAACGGGGGGGDSAGNGGGGGGGGGNGGGGTVQGSFTSTGDMTRARAGHTATLLANGKVFIAGPQLFTISAENVRYYHPFTELYSPSSGTSVAVNDAQNEAFRSFTVLDHVATTLFSGRILLSTGAIPAHCALLGSDTNSFGVLYDPTADTYTEISLYPATSRLYNTATLLPNGKVLLAGGSALGNYRSDLGTCPWLPSVATADLHDPSTGTAAVTGSMVTDRIDHIATLLPNGKVLITGGTNSVGALAVAELYDPATGIFTATGTMTAPRVNHTVTLLQNGRVLITGGVSDPATGPYLASAEVYDPATGLFTATGTMSAARIDHTATLLANGLVLIAGGRNDAGGTYTALASAELFNPATGTFTSTGSMAAGRFRHTATLVGDGRVMIAGGYTSTFGSLASVEVFQLN